MAILDADLQNDPGDLARLWDALPGHDAGLGWRVKREDVWSKRIISRWANRVRNWMLGQSIRDTGCAVRIFPREVALRFPMFHGAHRFYGPLLDPGGMPDRADPGGAPAEAAWEVALQHLEPVGQGDRRPVRGGLADASAGALSVATLAGRGSVAGAAAARRRGPDGRQADARGA